MRLAAYARSGGVHGAVARIAEDAFMSLDRGQQAAARRLLLRLSDEDEGRAIVRRRIPLAELEAKSGTELAEVIARLTDRRLLTVSDGAVEVAHEALLREWPRVRAWLEEDVQGRRLHRQLSDAARAWEADGREPGGLYRGARLAAALDWAADHDPDLNAGERAFLDDSRRATEHAQRRLQLMLASVASLLVLAVIAGAVALDQRGNARAEATAAAAQRLGAQALVEDDLDRALLLARQGVALDDSLQTRGNLLAALLKSPAAIGVLPGDADPLLSVDLSPDGRTLALLDQDGTLTSVDTRTRRPVGPSYQALGHEDYADLGHGFDDVQFSPDGTRLAVGGMAPAVLDARTNRLIAGLQLGRSERFVYAVRFSPDGRTLFALGEWVPEFKFNAAVQRFDAGTGRPLGTERVVTRRSSFVNLMVSRDGRRLVTTSSEDGTVIRDARTLEPLDRVSIGAEASALSPDGRTMLVGGRDGSVGFLDLTTGNLRRATGRHDAPVTRAAFTADGRRAVTTGADGRAIVWDVERPAATETLAGHAGGINALAIAPDDSTLYTAGLDRKVIAWDLAGTRRLGRSLDIEPALGPGQPPAHALRRDGRVLAVGHGDGTVTPIDARTLRPLATRFRVVPSGSVSAMEFVPGGPLLAVTGTDGFLAIVDPRDGSIVKRLAGHRAAVSTPSFSADGRRMATGDLDGIVRVWALPSGRPIGRLRDYFAEGVSGVSLSPDGRSLAIAQEREVDILDLAIRRPPVSLSGDPTVYDFVRFTADGRSLLVGVEPAGRACGPRRRESRRARRSEGTPDR